ncbi:MAG: hypothetical protein V3S89_12590, partial [Desulfobacterales bacterium]
DINAHLNGSLDRILGESLKQISNEMNTRLKSETDEGLKVSEKRLSDVLTAVENHFESAAQSLDTRMEAVRKEVQEAVASNAEIKSAVMGNNGVIADAIGDLAAKQNQEPAVSARLLEALGTLDSHFESATQSLDTGMAAVKEEVQAAVASNTEMKAAIMGNNGAIADAIGDLAAKQSQEPAVSAQLLTELDALKAGNKELQDANIDVLDTFHQLKNTAVVDSTKYEEEIRSLKARVSAAETEKERELSGYCEAAEKAEASREQLVLQIDSLKSELEAISDKHAQLVEINETSNMEADGTHAIIAESVALAEEAIRERDQIRQKLDAIQGLWEGQAAEIPE